MSRLPLPPITISHPDLIDLRVLTGDPLIDNSFVARYYRGEFQPTLTQSPWTTCQRQRLVLQLHACIIQQGKILIQQQQQQEEEKEEEQQQHETTTTTTTNPNDDMNNENKCIEEFVLLSRTMLPEVASLENLTIVSDASQRNQHWENRRIEAEHNRGKPTSPGTFPRNDYLDPKYYAMNYRDCKGFQYDYHIGSVVVEHWHVPEYAPLPTSHLSVGRQCAVPAEKHVLHDQHEYSFCSCSICSIIHTRYTKHRNSVISSYFLKHNNMLPELCSLIISYLPASIDRILPLNECISCNSECTCMLEYTHYLECEIYHDDMQNHGSTFRITPQGFIKTIQNMH